MTVTIDIAALFTGVVAVLFALLGGGIVWMLYAKARRFIASRSFEGLDRENMRRRWQEIERMIEEDGEMSLKIAVLESDKLLDHALKSLAFPGETLADRLRFASYKYPKLKQVWWAHKVRNQLVHESSYFLDRHVAQKAVRSFRKALELMGAI